MMYFAASFISVRCHKVARGIHCITASRPAVGFNAVPKGVFWHYRQVVMTVLIMLTSLHFE